MFLSGLFSRFSDAQRFIRRKRSLSSSRRSQLYEASMEQLEQKKLLTVEMYGITHSNYGNTTAEDFAYQVGVTNAGTGELWIRYNDLQNEVQFSDNSSFINTGRRGSTLTPSAFTNDANPFITTDDGLGGFSVATNVTINNQVWNDGTTQESFTATGVMVTADPGTKVFLANGDAFPFSLNIGANGSRGTRSSTFNAPFRNDPLPFNDHPDLIQIDGPISNAGSDPFWNRDETEFSAREVVLDAEIVTTNIEVRASDSVKFKNRTTGFLNSSVKYICICPKAEHNGKDIRVGATGADTNSGFGFGGNGGDILIDGTLNSSSINLQTNSLTQGTHIKTGASGVISGGNSLTIFNAGLDGGTIDVQTKNYSVTNVDVGSPLVGLLPDICISIDQD